ncbi:MAG: ABC transporter permease [Bacteroidales bacterium]|nr:ABC transporter permease [Bacteroidales bacterium]MCF8343900.1 ABC transporter permease [Bacteroidales bacterium]MCF8350889.1 ABC transporter permease [Bacteroidales bacterium]MCF8376911.1 ABC transporter permease [Bacteroidales bacterium]MCF8400820.1 ABC transporter permease [Bacteroidales bacterium]
MFWNYLKIAFRNLVRQKSYSLINIFGLTIGIAAFLMIMLYVQHELSYNSHIPNKDRLYRCVELQFPDGIDDQHVAVTMVPLGETLMENFPEITNFVRLWNLGEIPIGTRDGTILNQNFVSFTDTTVFELFGVELIRGDEETALVEPRSIIFSEKTAKKFFGSVDSAMNQIVTLFGFEGFKVTGVMENPPVNTHYRYEVLISMSTAYDMFDWFGGWESNMLDTYVQLSENADHRELSKKFKPFLLEYREISEEEQESFFDLYLQPVDVIHLKSGHIKFQVMNYRQGSAQSVLIFIIIAVLIVVIACVNYINIAIARSMKQAREVGMRKVLGASRSSLMYRFFGESFLLTVISIAFSLLLVEIFLPYFNDILRVDLQMDLAGNWMLNIGLLALLVLISLISGAYPAFYLSRFRPIKVLKGSLSDNDMKSGWLSKGLVVFQFVVSIALIFSIMALYKQINFLMNKDLGYNPDNVYAVSLHNNNDPDDLRQLKEKLLQKPKITGVAAASYYNGVAGNQSTIQVIDSAETSIMMRFGYVDYDFLDMMGMQIVEGRNFDESYAMDSLEAVIVNRAAVETLGWENPLEQSFTPFYDTLHNRKVIGVVEDYHYYSLHSKIEPAVYIIYPEEFRQMMVRVNGEMNNEASEYIEESWKEIFPGRPFEMHVVENLIQNSYRGEQRMMELFGYFAIISLIISSLGLYGLTTFIIQQKRKEIGIRKVLGSSSVQVILMLMIRFLKLVFIAGLIALPLAWYFMDDILAGFAYRAGISWYIFVIAMLVSLVIATITILYHATRAANSNPVDAISYE